MTCAQSPAELAAEEILALPERELLQPLSIVAPTQINMPVPTQIVVAPTLAVGGDVNAGSQANLVQAFQNGASEVSIEND